MSFVFYNNHQILLARLNKKWDGWAIYQTQEKLESRKKFCWGNLRERDYLRDLLVDGKVKVSLCFNWAPRHEGVLEEWRYIYTPFLNSLDGGEWSALSPGRFTPRERAPRLGGPQSRSGRDGEEKNSQPPPPRESKPRTPIVQSVVQVTDGG
jgi:hypothetical protein